uniref:Uncharacterized protein n=1 Tax=Rhizophora mucronata TaxID=61149 RepID=A0A2P2PRF9_RHIMU
MRATRTGFEGLSLMCWFMRIAAAFLACQMVVHFPKGWAILFSSWFVMCGIGFILLFGAID